MGNLAPEGSVIKSTAIDPSLIDENNVYRHSGPAQGIYHRGSGDRRHQGWRVAQGDVVVLICGGPKGAGMQEIYQVTSALKMLPHCKHVAVHYRCAVQRSFDGGVHRSHLAGGAGRWAGGQGARWRPDRDRDRSRAG